MSYKAYEDIVGFSSDKKHKSKPWYCIPCYDADSKKNYRFATEGGCAQHFSQHCGCSGLDKDGREDIIKKARHRRAESKPERKAQKKTPEYKAQVSAWNKKPEGRISKRKYEAKRNKEQPDRFKAFLKLRQQQGESAKSRQNPKRLNQKFALTVGGIFDTVRKQLASKFKAFIESEQGKSEIKQLLAKIDELYSSDDSTAYNYVYFYIDETLLPEDFTFADFLRAIFYVGRGIGPRFAYHVVLTQELLKKGSIDEEKKPKEARIAKVWSKGSPVQVVLLDFEKRAEKTDFIEFASTFVLGKDNLTNQKYDGASSTPLDFKATDVMKVGLSFLWEAFDQYEKKVFDLCEDRDYGPKYVYSG